MKFECGDLERALANSDLFPEAREHLKTCAVCRREYRLWNDISSVARELHEEWDTPALWPTIRQAIEAERKPERIWWKQRKTWAAAAALAIAIVVPVGLWRHSVATAPAARTQSSTPDFLTERALREVEKSEAAYRQSIARLSQLAAPKLSEPSSPEVANEKERLALLDSAIAETRASVASNRFNIRLQTALADLYRQKQETLRDLLSHDAKN
jgi:hypothetical protein